MTLKVSAVIALFEIFVKIDASDSNKVFRAEIGIASIYEFLCLNLPAPYSLGDQGKSAG